jgi:hypothetical protein
VFKDALQAAIRTSRQTARAVNLFSACGVLVLAPVRYSASGMASSLRSLWAEGATLAVNAARESCAVVPPSLASSLLSHGKIKWSPLRSMCPVASSRVPTMGFDGRNDPERAPPAPGEGSVDRLAPHSRAVLGDPQLCVVYRGHLYSLSSVENLYAFCDAPLKFLLSPGCRAASAQCGWVGDVAKRAAAAPSAVVAGPMHSGTHRAAMEAAAGAASRWGLSKAEVRVLTPADAVLWLARTEHVRDCHLRRRVRSSLGLGAAEWPLRVLRTGREEASVTSRLLGAVPVSAQDVLLVPIPSTLRQKHVSAGAQVDALGLYLRAPVARSDSWHALHGSSSGIVHIVASVHGSHVPVVLDGIPGGSTRPAAWSPALERLRQVWGVRPCSVILIAATEGECVSAVRETERLNLGRLSLGGPVKSQLRGVGVTRPFVPSDAPEDTPAGIEMDDLVEADPLDGNCQAGVVVGASHVARRAPVLNSDAYDSVRERLSLLREMQVDAWVDASLDMGGSTCNGVSMPWRDGGGAVSVELGCQPELGHGVLGNVPSAVDPFDTDDTAEAGPWSAQDDTPDAAGCSMGLLTVEGLGVLGRSGLCGLPVSWTAERGVHRGRVVPFDAALDPQVDASLDDEALQVGLHALHPVAPNPWGVASGLRWGQSADGEWCLSAQHGETLWLRDPQALVVPGSSANTSGLPAEQWATKITGGASLLPPSLTSRLCVERDDRVAMLRMTLGVLPGPRWEEGPFGVGSALGQAPPRCLSDGVPLTLGGSWFVDPSHNAKSVRTAFAAYLHSIAETETDLLRSGVPTTRFGHGGGKLRSRVARFASERGIESSLGKLADHHQVWTPAIVCATAVLDTATWITASAAGGGAVAGTTALTNADVAALASVAMLSACPVTWSRSRRLVAGAVLSDSDRVPGPIAFSGSVLRLAQSPRGDSPLSDRAIAASNSAVRSDRSGMVVFRGRVYFGANRLLAAVLATRPTVFLSGIAAVLPAELPMRVPMSSLPPASEMVYETVSGLRFGDAVNGEVVETSGGKPPVALAGLCPVSLRHAYTVNHGATGWELAAKHGETAFAVRFQGKLWLCHTTGSVKEFLSSPYTFASHPSCKAPPGRVPPHPRQCHNMIPERDLGPEGEAGVGGMLGYAELTTGRLLREAMEHFAQVRGELRHPTMSVRGTALKFLALSLRANDPHLRPHERARARKAFESFLADCSSARRERETVLVASRPHRPPPAPLQPRKSSSRRLVLRPSSQES